MNRLLVAVALLVAAVPAGAVSPVESLPSGALQAFDAASAFRARTEVGAIRAVVVAHPPRARAATGQSRRITLRGFVNVWGSAFIPGGRQGFVMVTVQGDAQLQDDSGHTLNGTVTLTDTSSYFVSTNYVSGFARPAAYVSLYKGSRYLGSVRVEGSIPVSGFASGGWLRLNGSGWVEGSAFIDDSAAD